MREQFDAAQISKVIDQACPLAEQVCASSAACQYFLLTHFERMQQRTQS